MEHVVGQPQGELLEWVLDDAADGARGEPYLPVVAVRHGDGLRHGAAHDEHGQVRDARRQVEAEPPQEVRHKQAHEAARNHAQVAAAGPCGRVHLDALLVLVPAQVGMHRDARADHGRAGKPAHEAMALGPVGKDVQRFAEGRVVASRQPDLVAGQQLRLARPQARLDLHHGDVSHDGHGPDGKQRGSHLASPLDHLPLLSSPLVGTFRVGSMARRLGVAGYRFQLGEKAIYQAVLPLFAHGEPPRRVFFRDVVRDVGRFGTQTPHGRAKVGEMSKNYRFLPIRVSKAIPI